jgi:hypothetical protein
MNGRCEVVRVSEPGERENFRTFDDVLTCSTPDTVDESDPASLEAWKRQAVGICKQYVWKQYRVPPYELLFGRADVLVTGDPVEAAAFQPGDACETCREGTEVAVAYLKEHPEASVTQVNLAVTEVW